MAYKNVVTLLLLNLLFCFFVNFFPAEATPTDHHLRRNSAIARLKRMESAIKAQASRAKPNVGVPVVGKERAYFMTVGMGHPPINIRSKVDTSSDLIWFDCSALPGDSSALKSVPCSSPLCTSNPHSTCSANKCKISHNSTDNQTMKGELFYGTFSMTNGSGGAQSFDEVAFACRSDGPMDTKVVQWNDGVMGINGVVGLGRGNLSLTTQIGESMFSYCLAEVYPDDSKNLLATPLLFGSAAELNGTGIQSTMILKNIALPNLNSYYYLSVEGISVGNKAAEIPQGTFNIRASGSGGFIIDSATPYTVLPHAAFAAVEFALDIAMDSNDLDYTKINGSRDGFSVCYQAPHGSTLPALNMTFHMAVGAEYVITSASNFVTYVEDDQTVVCLAILDMNEASVEHVPAVLGNFQQQNYHILYDNDKLSFVATNCSSLSHVLPLNPKYAKSDASPLSPHGLLLVILSIAIFLFSL